ncbi:MAG: DUF4349 domain-containing protein [Propionicimonas sp.]
MKRALVGLVALLALAGCSGSGTSAASVVPDAGGAVPGGATVGEAAPQSKPADTDTTLTPQIARSAAVTLRVPDVMAAATRLRELAAAAGGQVTAENLVVDATEQEYSSVVISVDAERLDSTLEALAGVGAIVSRVISSEDVTTQVSDVNARVAALNASIGRLQELSKKAGSVRELVEVETELSNRIAERDSMVAQQKALAGRVAQSQIVVQLLTPEQAGPLQTTGFLGGLQLGWNALVATGQAVATVTGALLPFAAVAVLIGVPLVAWRRRVHRRRSSAAVPEVPKEN